MHRHFLALVCAVMVLLGSVNSFADATCARAIAFYPADGRGNVDRKNPPIVIRVESRAATIAEARLDVTNRGNIHVESWAAKNKRSVSPMPMIRKVVTNGPLGWDEIGCWTSTSHLAARYRAIVDAWPAATFPANPRASLPHVIAPPVPVVPVDYLEDENRRWRWVQVGNKANLPLYSCSVTIYYHEVPPPGDATSVITAGQSLTRDKSHVIGPEENTKTAMRRWVRDELRATVNGLPWHEDDISVTCGRE